MALSLSACVTPGDWLEGVKEIDSALHGLRDISMKILVTGSSGYVASDLISRLCNVAEVYGVDLSPSEYTDIQRNISDPQLSNDLKEISGEGIYVINLAAARFDFGATAKDYFRLNVECHAKFLTSLHSCRIKKFIHISSVASLDGRGIPYSETLKCDDAYRSTKNLQEELIQQWCNDQGVDLSVVYPSAIFSKDPRLDTNIGKLQSLSRFLPFIPLIDVVKSLTYLPNLSLFIIDLVGGKVPKGKYLTIEKPLTTVTTMIQLISGRSIRVLRIPYLQTMMKIVSYVLYGLGGFGRYDLKLTPNRVVKLFSDTSYGDFEHENVDVDAYGAHNKDQLSDLLQNFNDIKKI